jgi:hypothetical protein
MHNSAVFIRPDVGSHGTNIKDWPKQTKIISDQWTKRLAYKKVKNVKQIEVYCVLQETIFPARLCNVK